MIRYPMIRYPLDIHWYLRFGYISHSILDCSEWPAYLFLPFDFVRTPLEKTGIARRGSW